MVVHQYYIALWRLKGRETSEFNFKIFLKVGKTGNQLNYK